MCGRWISVMWWSWFWFNCLIMSSGLLCGVEMRVRICFWVVLWWWWWWKSLCVLWCVCVRVGRVWMCVWYVWRWCGTATRSRVCFADMDFICGVLRNGLCGWSVVCSVDGCWWMWRVCVVRWGWVGGIYSRTRRRRRRIYRGRRRAIESWMKWWKLSGGSGMYWCYLCFMSWGGSLS